MSNKDFKSGVPFLHDIHRPLEEAEKFTARIGRNSREASKEVSLLRKEYQSFLAIGESLQSYDWGQKIVEKLEASDDSFDSDSDDDDNDWFRGERDSCGGVPKFKRDDDKEKKNKKEKKGSKDDEKEEQSDDNSENENDDDSKDDNYEPDFDYYSDQFDTTESESEDESVEDFKEAEESKKRKKHFGKDEPSSKRAAKDSQKFKKDANENKAGREERKPTQDSGLRDNARQSQHNRKPQNFEKPK